MTIVSQSVVSANAKVRNFMRKMQVAARFALVCLGLWAAAPALAAGSQFLKGYAQGVLDSEFPDLDLRVASTGPNDAVTVASPRCLTKVQRARVRARLTQGRHIHSVAWHMPCTATAKPPSQSSSRAVETLPNQQIFRPLLADPRAPRFSGYYQYHKNAGHNFNAGAASFGEDFGLVRAHFHGHPYQVGIEAAVFALFNLDTRSHDLVNADYMVGIPVTYRTGRFSYRARIYHISSHLGDEFLLNNPQVKRVNLSYEIADFLASWSRWGVRLYGGGGVIVQSDPSLDPAVVEFGGEYRYPRLIGPADLVAGADYKMSQTQDFGLNQSYILGLAFHQGVHTVRTVLQYYTGFSPNGQFYTEQVRYFGIGLQFEM